MVSIYWLILIFWFIFNLGFCLACEVLLDAKCVALTLSIYNFLKGIVPKDFLNDF